VRFQVITAASMKFWVFCDVAPDSFQVVRRFRGAYCIHHQGVEWFIALIMEAVRTSVTLVNFNVTTRRYIPEDFKLQSEYSFVPALLRFFVSSFPGWTLVSPFVWVTWMIYRKYLGVICGTVWLAQLCRILSQAICVGSWIQKVSCSVEKFDILFPLKYLRCL